MGWTVTSGGFSGEQVDRPAGPSENGVGEADSCDGGVEHARLETPVPQSSSRPCESTVSSVVWAIVCDDDAREPVNINASSSLSGQSDVYRLVENRTDKRPPSSKKYTRVLSPRMYKLSSSILPDLNRSWVRSYRP